MARWVSFIVGLCAVGGLAQVPNSIPLPVPPRIPVPSSGPETARRTGKVNGRVSSRGSGEVLRGAAVILAVLRPGTVGLPSNSGQRRTTTDNNGRFFFDPLETGQYQLSVSCPNFQPWSRVVTIQTGEFVNGMVVEMLPMTPSPAAFCR